MIKEKKNVGWLCFTTHRQGGHLETAKKKRKKERKRNKLNSEMKVIITSWIQFKYKLFQSDVVLDSTDVGEHVVFGGHRDGQVTGQSLTLHYRLSQYRHSYIVIGA